ncbi:MAG: AsmA family protein [Deltaproteobacteria bacterium]|nr:MAG: AsmA family protein [Deltaproteobacteria bacterium]
MKTFKRILAAALALLGAALLIVISIYLLVDDATLFAQMVKKLESSSEIRVLHRGDAHITRTLTPTLTVDDLIIGDAGRQYQVETGSLEVQISLLRLLLGQLDIPKLYLGDTRIEIREDASPSEPAAAPELKSGPEVPSFPLKPLLHDIRISRVEIIHEGDTVLLPDIHLSEFNLELKSDNTLELGGQVELAQQNIDVKAVLRDVDEYAGGKPLAFSVGVQSTGLNLSLEGNVNFEKPDPTLEIAARGWTPDGEKFATGIQGFEIPGKLTIEAQLKGTFAQLPMEELKAAYHGPNQSSVKLEGSIANVLRLEGVQFNLNGKLEDPAWLTPLLPESLGAIKGASVSARISGGYPNFTVQDLDFHGKTKEGLDLSLSGKFELANSLEPANIQAELVFAAPNTRAARFLIFETIPEFGAITGKCHVHSDVGDPSLIDIVVQTKDKSSMQANLSGGIAQFPLADRPNRGYDLDVSIRATEGAGLAERVGLELPELGPLDLNFKIEGSTLALELNQIKLSGGREEGVRIGAQGQMSFGDWDQADPFKAIDLKLQAQSLTTQLLSPWLGQKLPELGPLSGEAHLHTVSGLHRIDQLQIRTGETAPLAVAVSGSAEHIILLPELRVREIKLDANATTDNVGQLNTVFGLKDEIPQIGPLEAKAQISGDDQNLVVDEISVAAGQEDLLLVNLDGRLGKLSAANQWKPQNTSLTIQANSSNSRALAEKLGYRIPELGPLTAQANIRDKEKKVSMESVQVRLGDKDKPVLKFTGYINDLFAMKGVQGNGQLHLDGSRFAAFADFEKIPELGPLTGQVKISDTDGSLGIDSLQIESAQPEMLSLKVDGSFDNFKDPSTWLLESSLAARDLTLLGAMLDRQWPAIGPVRLEAEIKRTGKSNELKSTLTAGETEIEAKIKEFFETTPMRITGFVKARKMLFWELLEKKSVEEKKKASSKEPVFSREPIDFGWLKKADVDVAISVESFAQEQFLADSAQFQVKVKSGLLSISPARFVYAKGKLEMDLRLDARDHPRLTFKAFGENIDPRRALDIQQYKGQLEAEANIDLSFSTSGLTPHELAANSQGSIYITIQNGKLPAPLVDLVFWDVAGWVWKKSTDVRYYDFGCGVADYTIEKGVISTKAFILDAEHITVTGGGTIDLGGEKVEYFFLPKKKSLYIKKADPVNIEGPLNDPKVKTIPWKSAAITAGKVGGIIFAPFIFIPLTAADYLAGQVKIEDGKSACLEYQKNRKIEQSQQQSN